MKKNFVCWIDDLKTGKCSFLNCQSKVVPSNINHLSISINCAYAVFDYQLFAWVPEAENIYSDSFDFLSREPIKFDNFGSKKVAKIISNTQVCHIITEEGLVYSWGNDANQTGVLALGETFYQAAPVLNSNFKGKRISDIAISEKHGVAIDICHHVHTWGTGTNGELGLNSVTKTLTPVKVTTEVMPWMVKCGATYTVLLDMTYRAHYMGVINKALNQRTSIDLFGESNLELNCASSSTSTSTGTSAIKKIQFHNRKAHIENVFCGDKLIALVDTNGLLYLCSEEEGLNRVVLDLKIKSVKFIRSNIYALTKESDYLYFFSSRTELNPLREYVENLYSIDQGSFRIKIIETPFYNDALFLSVECTNANKERVESKRMPIFTSIKSIGNSSSLMNRDDLNSNSLTLVNNIDNYSELHVQTKSLNCCTKSINSIYSPSSSSINSSQGFLHKRTPMTCSNNFDSVNNDNTLRISHGSNTSNINNGSRIDRISTLLDKIMDKKLETILSNSNANVTANANALTKSSTHCLGKKKIELERIVPHSLNTNKLSKTLINQSEKAYQRNHASDDLAKFNLTLDYSHKNEKKKINQSQDNLPSYYDRLNQFSDKTEDTVDSNAHHQMRSKAKERNKWNKRNKVDKETKREDDFRPVTVFFGTLTKDSCGSNKKIKSSNEIAKSNNDNDCKFLNDNSNNNSLNQNLLLLTDDAASQRIRGTAVNKISLLSDISKSHAQYLKQKEENNDKIESKREDNERRNRIAKETKANSSNMGNNPKKISFNGAPTNISIKSIITQKQLKVKEKEDELNSNSKFSHSQTPIKLESQSFLTQKSSFPNKTKSTQGYFNEEPPSDLYSADSKLIKDGTGKRKKDANGNTDLIHELLSREDNRKETNEDHTAFPIEIGQINPKEKVSLRKSPNQAKMPKSYSMISINPLRKEINYKRNSAIKEKEEETIIGKYMGKEPSLPYRSSFAYFSRDNKEKDKKTPSNKTPNHLDLSHHNRNNDIKTVTTLKSHNTSVCEIGIANQTNYSSALSLKILNKAKEQSLNAKCIQPKASFRAKRNNHSSISSNNSEGITILRDTKDKKSQLNKEQSTTALHEASSQRNRNFNHLSIDNNDKKPNLTHIQMPTPVSSKYSKPKALQSSLDLFRQRLFGYLENSYGKDSNKMINQFLAPNNKDEEEEKALFRDFLLKEFNPNDFVNPTESAISYKDFQEDVRSCLINNFPNFKMDKIKERQVNMNVSYSSLSSSTSKVSNDNNNNVE